MNRLVPCPFRGDHRIVEGRMHGPSQCPPPAGEHGERRRNKRLAARKAKKANEGFIEARGVAVAGVGGGQAKSHRAGKKKSVKVGTTT